MHEASVFGLKLLVYEAEGAEEVVYEALRLVYAALSY